MSSEYQSPNLLQVSHKSWNLWWKLGSLEEVPAGQKTWESEVPVREVKGTIKWSIILIK